MAKRKKSIDESKTTKKAKTSQKLQKKSKKNDNKTKPSKVKVSTLISSLDLQKDICEKLLEIFEKTTKMKGKIWGQNIIGFGSYHYRYKSGREGDYFITGFAPRKKTISLYIMDGLNNYEEELIQFGINRSKCGVSCMHIKNLDGIDENTLINMIEKSVANMKSLYECSTT